MTETEYERQWLAKAAKLTHNADYTCIRCGTRWRQFVPETHVHSTCPRCGTLAAPEKLVNIRRTSNG